MLVVRAAVAAVCAMATDAPMHTAAVTALRTNIEVVSFKVMTVILSWIPLCLQTGAGKLIDTRSLQRLTTRVDDQMMKFVLGIGVKRRLSKGTRQARALRVCAYRHTQCWNARDERA